MKHLTAALAVAALVLAGCSGTDDGEVHPADATKSYVADMIDYWDDHGADAAIRYYNSKDSTMASTYGAIFETGTGIVLAHPWRSQLIGVPLPKFDVLQTQPGDGGEWWSYVHESPVDGVRQLKHTWVVDHDGHSFVSGWYEAINPVG